MICLKNRTFAVSQTTVLKVVIFVISCDLLEKSYFCSIANNGKLIIIKMSKVVICLKNRTFAVSQTTYGSILPIAFKLWFAWKIVLLQYRKQHWLGATSVWDCCDLLEKSYFCSIANNPYVMEETFTIVVICLKNRTFAVSQTTQIHIYHHRR